MEATRRASRRRSESTSPRNEEEGRDKKKSRARSRSTTPKPESAPAPSVPMEEGTDDPIEYVKNLPKLQVPVPNVKKLSETERQALENVLELDPSEGWADHWTGNLGLCEKDVLNPSVKGKAQTKFRQPLIHWAENAPGIARYLRNLLRAVCTMTPVPQTVKRILLGGVNDSTPVEELIKRIRRAPIDPQVLQEDGWVLEKSEQPVGATGGPFLIGDKIRYNGADAVVFAYIHDTDIGDLWKALWVDDFLSFDLEAEELLESKKKWERRYLGKVKEDNSRRSARLVEVKKDYLVKGIEFGIVLAASYAKGARQGVYWPARVMHASEFLGDTQSRRSKQRVDLVYLAPYWRPDDPGARKRIDSMSNANETVFESNPLLHIETVDASDEMIQEFPYASDEIDISQLQMSFRFTGLPKSAFGRYVDSHRLATALLHYAKTHITESFTPTDEASAGLFESHLMSVKAPMFPSVILHLPFDYILSQLPRSMDHHATVESESVLQLHEMVEAMKPPRCWGETEVTRSSLLENGVLSPLPKHRPNQDPGAWLKISSEDENSDLTGPALQGFMTSFPHLNDAFNKYDSSPPLVGVLSSMTRLLSQLAEEEETAASLDLAARRARLKSLVTSWTMVKRLGEECLASLYRDNAGAVLHEWRSAAEKIYAFLVQTFSDGKSLGDGVSLVITDSRCNEHRTSGGCFERPVRLPAAIKAAKLAGSGTDPSMLLVTAVPDKYVDFVEKKILPKAHTSAYLKRMKSRCAAAKTDEEVLTLTDNTDGEGGEDTSKFSFIVLAFLMLVF